MSPDGSLNIPQPKPYSEQLKERHAAQEGLSRTEIKQQLAEGGAVVEDLEEIVEQGRVRQHNWVDRGLKLSCEGAGHPQHEVWKPRKHY